MFLQKKIFQCGWRVACGGGFSTPHPFISIKIIIRAYYYFFNIFFCWNENQPATRHTPPNIFMTLCMSISTASFIISITFYHLKRKRKEEKNRKHPPHVIYLEYRCVIYLEYRKIPKNTNV